MPTRTPKPKDAEVTAMQTIALVLAPLTQVEKDRVVRWAYDRYIAPVGPTAMPVSV
jgi:hypothetical protein